jgi:catechol 2,3-dioxygenase-like lactoylglutathione lyase family enzyme
MPFALTGLTPLIQVHDMPEAIRFWCGTLGFELVSSSPEIDAPEGRYFHWALLRQGAAELMLNTVYDEGERPAARDAARESGHRDTCLYIGCADVDALHAELTSRGLRLEPPVTAYYGMRQIYLRDPDGFELCFQTPAR